MFMEVRLGRNKVISLSFVVLPVSPQFVDSMEGHSAKHF